MDTSDGRAHSPFRRLRNSMSRHSNTVRLATLCSILNKLWDLAPPLLIGVAVDVVVEREESLMAGIGIIDPWHQLVILSIATFVIWGLESIFEYQLINENICQSDLVIQISNDSWFGKWYGPQQHLANSLIRVVSVCETLSSSLCILVDILCIHFF